jgi:hypothetical protein
MAMMLCPAEARPKGQGEGDRERGGRERGGNGVEGGREQEKEGARERERTTRSAKRFHRPTQKQNNAYTTEERPSGSEREGGRQRQRQRPKHTCREFFTAKAKGMYLGTQRLHFCVAL